MLLNLFLNNKKAILKYENIPISKFKELRFQGS